jgi:hypothetical protein
MNVARIWFGRIVGAWISEDEPAVGGEDQIIWTVQTYPPTSVIKTSALPPSLTL